MTVLLVFYFKILTHNFSFIVRSIFPIWFVPEHVLSFPLQNTCFPFRSRTHAFFSVPEPEHVRSFPFQNKCFLFRSRICAYFSISRTRASCRFRQHGSRTYPAGKSTGKTKNIRFLLPFNVQKAVFWSRDRHQYCFILPWLVVYGFLTAAVLVLAVPLAALAITK